MAVPAQSKRPVIKVCTPTVGIDALLEKTKGRDVVNFFDYGAVVSQEHLLFAYANAMANTSNKTARARSTSVEMLLCAALTSQIGDAIKRVGAKGGKRMVVFCDTEAAFGRISEKLSKIGEFRPSAAHTKAALRALGVGDMDALLSEMAVRAMEH
jgi:tRNA threonylcarbamoyladenosine modification (KEOPS) complex Cgi121 subunit